ncbi:toxin TcdB middle/N-terminal domain-containing protein [Shewanella nanhaiensis]|uniref:FG-GAP-like repeat-containing protein n=1 Tax=Shewanella nanhaiensis TaxID=2864872 RepID=A0ABS7E3N7_9GAMM|nr:toxin TcdB middle/N-terminal domain-containing protein [Shewanella nanhaiensis]MBW8184280.1 FG-GAP-like repeat-containing protein [Shewanella nanhaiensis]
MLKQWIAIFLLFLSCVGYTKADLNSDYQGYEVYTDSSGNIILRLPPKFVLIAGDINIPLHITPKNGVFKLVESSNSWVLQPMTQGEFDNLSLTPASHLALEFHDIDGDGILDILIRDSSSYRDSFVISNLQGTANVDAYSDARNGIDLSQGTQLTITDVNGDGIKDIVSTSGTYLGSRSGRLVDTSASDSFTNPGNIIGLTAGQFKVTESGAATYNIPLTLPPGTAGVAPQVALSYSSQGGEGILGMGWNISGLSAISRCPKSIAVDGKIDGIKYNSSDALCFNGQRLILNTNSSNEYHTEIDNFSVIKAFDGTNGPAYFTVTTQANETHYYGKAPSITAATDAYVERGGFAANTAAKIWVLKAIVDNKGNYIRYDYIKNTTEGSHILDKIVYGGNVTLGKAPYNSIEFSYSDVSRSIEGYANGGILTNNKRLQQIKVKQDSELFRSYDFTWLLTEIPEERNYVTGIQECFDEENTNCLPATTFEFEQPTRKTTTLSYEMCHIGQTDTANEIVCNSVTYCDASDNEAGSWCKASHSTPDLVPFESSSYSAASSNSDRFYTQVLDFNGDGYADMLFLKNSKWNYYTTDWEVVTNESTVSLPTRFSQNYLNAEPIVRTIKTSSITNKTQVISNASIGEKGYARVIDYNGDGKQDLLIPFTSGNWHVISSDPSTGEEENCEPLWQDGNGEVEYFCETFNVNYDFTYKSLGISSSAYKNTIVADVDGDGLQDIVFKSGSTLKYYHNLGGTFSAAKSISLALPASFSGATAYQAYGNNIANMSANIKNSAMIDVNGDGLTDIVMKVKKTTEVLPDPGCGEIPYSQKTESITSQQEVGTNGYDCGTRFTYSYKTFAFVASVSSSGQVTYTATDSSRLGTTLKALRAADFNGDGLTDIAYISGERWYYRLSKGDGTFTAVKALVGIEAKTANIYNRHQFVDLDADGRADILAATSTKKYNIILSGPSSTAESANFIERGSILVGTNSNPIETAMRLADVDGDAKLDLLYASSSTGSWKIQKATRPYTKEHVLTKITNGFGVETNIAYAPLNSGIPLINLESSQKPNDEDYITPIAGMYVVTEAATQSTDTESVLVQYAYGGPLAHKKGRGFLGFETVQTTDPQSNVVTTTQYHQLYPLTGMPKSTIRKYKDDLLSKALNTYTETVSASGGVHVYLNTSKETSYALDLSSDGTTATNHKTVSETLTTNTHDNANNLTRSLVEVKNAAGSVIHKTQTDNVYSNSAYAVINSNAVALARSHSQKAAQSGSQPDAKRFGRLYTTTVTKTRNQNTASGQSESQTRSTKFSYYPNGMLRESQVNGLTTAFFYDKYGNKVAEQSYGKHNSSSYHKRGQYWFYDSRGQYLASQMNQNGESETYLYNGKSGTTATPGRIFSKTTTGPNKLASTSYFDIQGQVVRQVLADGNYTETNRSLCTTCDKNFITETTSSSNKPQSVSYFDKFGRQREQQVKGFDGSWIVTGSTYDKLGRVTHQSVPNYGAASSVKSRQYYDALGRVYKQDKLAESGTVTVYSKINGLVTTSIDEKGLQYKDTYSADGQLIARTDPQSQVINYYYDAFGNTRKVTTKARDKSGAWKNQSITTGFDAYGRKTTTNDPDKGSWSYTYNDFGELLTQTDAKNQTTTTQYDAMGRMLWRKDNTSLSCWGYGSSTSLHNVGKPAWVKQWAGQTSCATSALVESSETYHYDDYGRPAQTDFIVDGSSYSTRSEYNAKGQLSRQHYPSNNGTFYVNFYYNANNYLYLQRDSSNRDLRKITAMDALGNITNQTFANGTSEERGFNSRTGRISYIDLAKGSRDIHKLSYGSFDAKGNVEFRAHSYYNSAGGQTLSFSETFTYDTLNRIETRDLSVGSGSLTGYSYDEKYSYDGFGNIKSRKGYASGSYSVNLASYDYLQTVSANRLNSATVDGKTYSKFNYDANGNIESDGRRTFTYNAFDKASRIQAGSQYTDYRYNHNRAVFSRTDYRLEGNDWKTFKTDYVGKIYQKERRYTGSTLENTRHKYMLGNIMVVRNQNTTLGNSEEVQYQHTDHQGSILTVTNKTGDVLEQYFYTAFGKPMKLSGSSIVQAIMPIERGYTGHEMLPGLDIIQMGGRIYDPTLARFMQADPFIQAPSNLQNYNRYSYVLNNPLTYTDPSGYFFDTLAKLAGFGLGGIKGAILSHHTHRFISNSKTLTQLSVTAVGVVTTIFCGPCSIGFTALATSTLTYYATGDLRASIHAGGRAALSAAVFYGIGQAFNADATGFFTQNGPGHIFAHGVAGGVLAEIQGGDFGSGFLAAGLSKAAFAANIVPNNIIGGAIVSAAIGGTASVVSGGKFANGAMTAAFAFALNGALTKENNTPRERVNKKLKEFKARGVRDTDLLAANDLLRGMDAGDLVKLFPEYSEEHMLQFQARMGVLKSEFVKDAALQSALSIGKGYAESTIKIGLGNALGAGSVVRSAFTEYLQFGVANLPTNVKSQYIIRSYGEAYFGL